MEAVSAVRVLIMAETSTGIVTVISLANRAWGGCHRIVNLVESRIGVLVEVTQGLAITVVRKGIRPGIATRKR